MWTQLPYLLQVQIALTLLWLFFSLILQRETRFGLSRAYLLLSVPAAFLLPLLHIPVFPGPEIPMSLLQATDSPLPAAESLSGASGPDARFWLYGLAVLGSVALGAVALFQVFRWLRLMRRCPQSTPRAENVRLVYTSRVESACSLFGWVFLNRENLRPQEQAYVLQHEMAHVRLRHSWDRLLAEGVRILLWWNPAVWMWHRSLVEVHEFQADQAVLDTEGEVEPYIYLLLRTSGQVYPSLVSGFSYSLLRRRLKMIGASQRGWWSRCRIALVIPLLGVLLGLFSFTRGEAVLVNDLADGPGTFVEFDRGGESLAPDGGPDTTVVRLPEGDVVLSSVMVSDDPVVIGRPSDTVRVTRIFTTTRKVRNELIDKGKAFSSMTVVSRDSALSRAQFMGTETASRIGPGRGIGDPDLWADENSRETAERRQQAAVRARQAKVRTRQAQVREQQAKVREQEAKVREQQARVREQQALTREQQARVREQQALTREQAAKMLEQYARVREQEAKTREQEAKVREQEARIREQEAVTRAQQAKVREQQARVLGQEVMKRLGPMPPAGGEHGVLVGNTRKLGKNPAVIVDGVRKNMKSLDRMSPEAVESITVFKLKEEPEGKIVITTKKGAARKAQADPDRQAVSVTRRETSSTHVQHVGANAKVVVDGVEQTGPEALSRLSPDRVASITVFKEKEGEPASRIIITTKAAALKNKP